VSAAGRTSPKHKHHPNHPPTHQKPNPESPEHRQILRERQLESVIL
jgi:hypothetical protein